MIRKEWEKMITHIVLFKMKDRSPESIERTAQVLRNMEGKIDVLRHLEVGTDVLHSDRSYDIALYTKFDSMEDLQAYQVHPEHKKVIEHMTIYRDASVSLDYES
jgi:heme-degrading monooxygenase HmoA